MRSSKRAIATWLLMGCFLVYAMVLVGGLTRLTGSGLSMVEWTPTGSLPPLNEAEWNSQFEKYKSSPEFKLKNYNFSLSDFKKIFWWEYIHRFLGRLTGGVFIVPFLYFFTRKKIPAGFLKKILLLAALGALQGFLGWFMVKSGLIRNPRVSHYRLAAHLAMAFTVFGYTFWLALSLLFPEKEEFVHKKMKSLLILLLTVVSVQVIYGAFVAGLKAGYLYPTFPKMGGQWLPAELLSCSPFWKNFTEGPTGVQFVHRVLAFIVVLAVGIVLYKARRLNLTKYQREGLFFLGVVVITQFWLGIVTVVFHVPVIFAALHQTFGFVLFGSTLFCIHRFR